MMALNNIKDKIKQINDDICVVYLCLMDKHTPKLVKIIAFACVSYALSPIDLIPDFIPILGYLDNFFILPLLISLSLKLIPKEVLDLNKDKAKDLWKDGKPKRWYYAIPIVLVWIIILYTLIK